MLMSYGSDGAPSESQPRSASSGRSGTSSIEGSTTASVSGHVHSYPSRRTYRIAPTMNCHKHFELLTSGARRKADSVSHQRISPRDHENFPEPRRDPQGAHSARKSVVGGHVRSRVEAAANWHHPGEPAHLHPRETAPCRRENGSRAMSAPQPDERGSEARLRAAR
jgi:hypothetical protein